MKTARYKFTFSLLALLLAGTAMWSCKYKEIVSSDYPDQVVYLPAALNGVYEINTVYLDLENNPSQGGPYRFVADRATDEFRVPLSAYRAGIDEKGDVRVTIAVDEATVNRMIADGELDTAVLLPRANYTVPSSVTIPSGSELGSFDLTVDLSFLYANAPNAKYAVALTISTDDAEINEDYATVVVVIDTAIMVPEASFTYRVDVSDWRSVTFTSTSANAVEFSWDFGDGSSSTSQNPTHTYEDQGEYTITLTATGLYGDVSTASADVAILQIELIGKEKWSIVDFSTEEPAEGNGNGFASCIIDDDLSTFWHSQWNGGEPGYPHHVTIDMGEVWKLTSVVTYRRPDDDRGQRRCRIETSLDGVTWEDQGEFDENPWSNDGQTHTLANYPVARYIKYVATEGPNFFAFLAELTAYGASVD